MWLVEYQGSVQITIKMSVTVKVSKPGYLYLVPESRRRLNGAGRLRTGPSSVTA